MELSEDEITELQPYLLKNDFNVYKLYYSPYLLKNLNVRAKLEEYYINPKLIKQIKDEIASGSIGYKSALVNMDVHNGEEIPPQKRKVV